MGLLLVCIAEADPVTAVDAAIVGYAASTGASW
jgi:hypothetical protein